MRRLQKLLLALVTVGLFALSAGAAATTARLILAHETAKPGDTVMAGIHLKMEPKWHTYWRNPGESGAATTVKWSLPPGVTAGEIQWPLPEKLPFADLVTYGYHDEVVLLVPLKLASALAPGPHSLKAKIDWLECEEACVPGKQDVSATLTIGAAGKLSADAPLIEEFRGRLPLSSASVDVQAGWDGPGDGKTRNFVVVAPAKGVTATEFFPDYADNFEVSGKTVALAPVSFQKTVKKSAGDWPKEITGVLVQQFEAGTAPAAFEVKLSVGAQRPATSAMTATPARGESSIWTELFYAFIGGLILNIMPCVLPVISLKIFGFIKQSGESPARLRVLGLSYGAGVILSLLALAAFVIALQRAGEVAGWGIQFQNPLFVVGVIALVTLVALNLFGLFEVVLTGGAMTVASDLSGKEGVPGAFFNGALAVVLATPCTAPFMTGALGYAFRPGQSPLILALFFLTIGVGLAFPYVLLCFAPKLMRFLPKPGAWMEKFKIALGFPVLATAVWLFSTVAPAHYGDKLFWLGIFLVLLALAAWVFGEFYQRGRKRRGLALGITVLLLAVAYGYALEHELNWRHPPAPAEQPVTGAIPARSDEISWEPWSAEALAKARAQGRPVFVDFTAKWCVTCQVNKKTSIEIDSVRAKLKAINAVTLLGDFTRKDPVIAAELIRFETAGVPLVLVYPKDATKPPVVLPQVLTPGIVLEALQQAAD